MLAAKTKINQEGQMVVEAAASLAVMGAVLGACLYISYLVIVFEWSDFWSYRALICVAEQKQIAPCQKQLNEKLGLLLLKKNYRIEELWMTKKEIKISVRVQLPLKVQRTFQKQIALPFVVF